MKVLTDPVRQQEYHCFGSRIWDPTCLICLQHLSIYKEMHLAGEAHGNPLQNNGPNKKQTTASEEAPLRISALHEQPSSYASHNDGHALQQVAISENAQKNAWILFNVPNTNQNVDDTGIG